MRWVRKSGVLLVAVVALSSGRAAVAGAENSLPTILWLPGTEQVTTKGTIDWSRR